MVFVWVFADNVEDSLGHVRFLIFYLLCSIGAGYAYVLADPGSLSPVIGASGAVAGVIAAYLMLHPFGKVWILAFGRIPLRLGALWVLGFWIVYQVIGALIAEDDQIAWVSHVGGVIVGAALVPLLKRREVKLFRREPVAAVAVPVAPSRSVDGGNPPR
jgi:membrane associated rhomboid family serine protease